MKFSVLYSIGLMLASANAACDYIDGNYYCSAVQKITYGGIGYSGSYDEITSMDSSSGTCGSTSKSFSGELSPLDEELSLHFRGPIKLKQFGVYYPSSKNSKREQQVEECDTTMVHKHHQHKRATQIIEVTQTVWVDGNGVTQTSTGTSTGTIADGTDVPDGAKVVVGSSSSSTGTTTSSTADDETTTSSSSSSAAAESSEAASGDWTRSAYYTPGSADGLVFFNHYGGDGSGVFDYTFGNSISYSNSDCSGGSSSPVALDDVLVDSNNEYLIMSDSKCSGDDCGFYREGIPAYHGFGGAQKIFVFEFQMPKASGSKTAINYDMPAIWALNAKIPRTLQYGKAECSCWPACGELDLFEVLSAGSNKMITHYHSKQNNNGGGSSDYFERPYDSTMKAAVIFDGDDITVVEVDDDFSSSLSQSTIDKWIKESGTTVTI